MSVLTALLARVRHEPALVGGGLLAVGNILVESPSWDSAGKGLAALVIAVLVRQRVTPV